MLKPWPYPDRDWCEIVIISIRDFCSFYWGECAFICRCCVRIVVNKVYRRIYQATTTREAKYPVKVLYTFENPGK